MASCQAPGGPEEDTSGGFRYGGWTVGYCHDIMGKVMDKQMAESPEELFRRSWRVLTGSRSSKTYSEFTKLIITPDKLVSGALETVNKEGYRILAWLCIISGNFLSFSGAVTNMWLTDTISRGGISDPSAFSPIYTYSSILLAGGIILIVIGIIFILHARQATAPASTS